MMRAQTHLDLEPGGLPWPRALRLSLLLGAAFAFALPATVAAQEIPDEFSLPAPSPTPTPAPQGPADERAGVRIGPRVIGEERTPAPTPTPQPSPRATVATPTPSPTRTPAPSSARTAAPTSQTTPTPSSSRTGQPAERQGAATASTSDDPDIRNEDAQGAEIAVDEPAGPGFETFDADSDAGADVGAGGWYDVDRVGEETDAASAPAATGIAGSTATDGSLIGSLGGLPGWISAALALLVALLGAVAWVLWRRREQATPALAAPDFDLATGVRRTFGESMPTSARSGVRARPGMGDTPSPGEKEPGSIAATAMREPTRVDLGLTIDEASRSVMRFTIEFTLEIFNRSDHALRDLNISAKLACAQRGAGNSAPVAGGQPIAQIERIGPQQSRRVSGKLQLPVEEITPISQGGKPVLIPLLHFTLDSEGQPAIARTFVVGTPSASSKTRVHPLLLEGPPGGFARLRAHLIRQPDLGDTAAARSTEPV